MTSRMIDTTSEKSSSRTKKMGKEMPTGEIRDWVPPTDDAVAARIERNGITGGHVALLVRMTRNEDRRGTVKLIDGIIETGRGTSKISGLNEEIRIRMDASSPAAMVRVEADMNKAGSVTTRVRRRRTSTMTDHPQGTEIGAGIDKVLTVNGTGVRDLSKTQNGWMLRIETSRARLIHRKISNAGKRE